MIRFFRKIHLWLSVPFGIIIALVCFSGAMLVFEPEITRAVNSEVYYVREVTDSPLPLDRLLESVKSTLPDSVGITGVTVFADKNRTFQVNLSKPRRASLFIDQYTGKITGRYERLGFFSAMFKLHRWLLDSANPHGDGLKVGKTLVGISVLVFVIALLSGIVIWWPRARKGLRRSLSISFDKGWKGFWKGLHVAGGMYALLFVLAMALTGLTWSFDWYRSAFYAVCGVEHTPRSFAQAPEAGTSRSGRPGNGETRSHEGRTPGEEARVHEDGARGHRHGDGGRGENGRGDRRNHRRMHSEYASWQQVCDELEARYPGAPQISVAPGNATVTLGTLGNGRASDRYEFDSRTGALTLSTAYSAAPGADRLRGWIYAVHTGGFLGLFSRIVWFLAALLGASLPVTGYYIWIKHLGKKKEPRPNRG